MKALTIWQPWASLKVIGTKQFETRGWKTSYRGPIAIHAAAKKPPKQGDLPWEDFNSITTAVTKALGHWRFDWDNIPLGCIIATAELVECWEIHGAHGRGASSKDVFIDKYYSADLNGVTMISREEYVLGDFTPGRYAWEFVNMKLLPEPIPARGQQGLWNWTPHEGGLQYADVR